MTDPHQKPGAPILPSLPVLIVDDNYENRYLLETILKANGYLVESAKNGKEALDYLHGNRVCLIISDVLMPKMDGFQLCREVKKDPDLKKIPFVFYTSQYTNKEDSDFGLDLGADRYIMKPSEPDAFLAEINGVLSELPKVLSSEPNIPHKGETEYLGEYSERLSHQLERKIRELEKKNKDYEEAEQLLRENQLIFRDLVENLNEVVFTLDVNGIFTYLSPVAESLDGGFGYLVADLIGHSFTEIIHPDDLAKVGAKFKETLAGHPKSSQFRVITKSGNVRWIEESGRRIQKDGKITGLQGLFSDITKRKETEEALRKSEQEYRAVAEISDDAIFIIDADFKIERFNSRFAECMQIDPATLPGMAISDCLSGECYEECRTIALKVRETNAPSEQQVLMKLPEESRWFRIRIAPLSPDGVPDRFLVYATDIHDVTILRQALEITNKKLNLLTSILRHDILNYLMGIMAGREMIETQCVNCPMYPDLLKNLQFIKEGASAIERLLNFSREYQSLGVKEPQWYNIYEVISEVMKEAKFAETTFDIDIDRHHVFADPLFYRVIYNLFENALVHGESVTTITVRFEEEGATGILTIRDDGVGVPPEEKEKIFNEKYGTHTGYGLFFSREILSITGITIAETGVFGEGAVFEMRMPEGCWRVD